MKIGLVTPLHNEVDSIDELYTSIENQNINIAIWVIVENGSTDGSKELLRNKKPPGNVKKLIIFNEDKFGGKHELGFKYSSIISYGFKMLFEANDGSLDYIGILDSDCFPESLYYCKLQNFLASNKNVGIASGVIYLNDGSLDESNKNWVRGGCRLWKMECFNQSGYIVGPSADAISSAKAELKGWDSKVCHEAKVFSREVGARVSYTYYGYATYYRGCSISYAILKSCYLLFKSPKKSYGFILGYFGSILRNKKRIDDLDVLNFYNNYLINKKFKR